MGWTGYLMNSTGEVLACSGFTLNHGDWKQSPAPSVPVGQSISFECDSMLGNVSGWVSYTGARGGVTVTWSVPLIGDTTTSATPSGVYAVTRMGGPTHEGGGAMYSVQAPPPEAPKTTDVPVAPASPTTPQPTPHTVAPKGDSKKYTTNPNEVTTVRTTPTLGEVVGVLKSSWPDLTEAGARTLASQWASETGYGRYCFNFNFGNVKGTADQSHMYLRGVWELLPPASADKVVAGAGGQAHIATDAERNQHGWACDANHKVVVFDPPNTACRFRAFATLVDGSAGYVAKHQSIAAKQKGYLDAINAGDTDTVATVLHNVGYYTATLASYKSQMKSAKKKIDATLGTPPASPPPSQAAPSQP
jgi:hypothetical protein